jgi:transposase-like protein
MPTFISVRGPHCHSALIVTRGQTARGTQRYLCQNQACITGSFLLDYRNRGYLPEVKQLIIDMSLKASGVRDTARSLHQYRHRAQCTQEESSSAGVGQHRAAAHASDASRPGESPVAIP